MEIVCIPPHQLAPGETQAKIVVKSLMEAVTGAEVLDVFNSHSPRTETETPHATPLAESPPPGPMMAEEGPPAVRGKEDGRAMVSTCAKVSCM